MICPCWSLPFQVVLVTPALQAPDSLACFPNKKMYAHLRAFVHAVLPAQSRSLHSVPASLLPCLSSDFSVNMTSSASSPRPLRLNAAPRTFSPCGAEDNFSSV